MITLTVFLKELVDILRDRRALFSGLVYVAFGPTVILFTVNTLAAQSIETGFSSIRFCHAESKIVEEALTSAGLSFATDAKICLNLARDFETRLADGRQARIQLRADLTAQASTIRKVETTLSRFSATLADMRLLARGIAPSAKAPLMIDTQNTNLYSRQADVITRMLIIMFVLAPFFVSVAASADMTAGERERRSLEPLLVHPVNAISIVAGKWLAASTLGILGTAVCVFGGLYLLNFSALDQLGIRLETDIQSSLLVTLYLAPLALLVAALQTSVGLWSKSYKDAQNYLMLLSFAPAIAGFVFIGEKLAKAEQWPLIWELNALAAPMLGAAAPETPFAVIAASELAITMVLLVICAYRLRSEGILSKA